jgi:inosose dehydratase
MNQQLSRRAFARTAAIATGALLCVPDKVMAGETKKLHIATNGFAWQRFYSRSGRNFEDQFETAVAEMAAAGLDGYEGGAATPEALDAIHAKLTNRGLKMRSLYVNSTLHDPEQVDASIRSILRVADRARVAGTEIIVTNPNPIRWGGPENKSDEQIRFQARALNRLGAALKDCGLTLAYHFHDIELRMAARELHHMLVGTDPALVTLCLDAHWIYRGAGNSEIAVFDIARLYADRISELHIRQSKDGTWSETFGPGDINYPELVRILAERDVRPLLVLEQAVEKESPDTMTAEQAHRKSVEYARGVFAPLA